MSPSSSIFCWERTLPDPLRTSPRPSSARSRPPHRPNDRCGGEPVGRGRGPVAGRTVSFVDRLLTALRSPLFIALGLAAVYLLQTMTVLLRNAGHLARPAEL